MIVISSTDLKTNQRKYFDLAEKERVIVKRGAKFIELVVKDNIEENDLARAITGDALLKGIKADIREMYRKQG
ncbi:hypothetical protein FACS189416_1730 [Bacteroidia bacterium]|nr:hypothetical protein FACS189416_1730 [Bacteroidia bacterium]